MNADESRFSAALDARRSEREVVETAVRLRLETETVEGISDNLSEAGIMFFTSEPVRCIVEVAEGGERRSYTGRIVRLQRMNESSTGLAVEFDAD